MSDLDPLDEALLMRAREGLDPTDEDHARVRRGLLTKLGVAATGATATIATSATANASAATVSVATIASASGVALATKIAVFLVVVSAVTGGAAVVTSHAIPTPSAPRVVASSIATRPARVDPVASAPPSSPPTTAPTVRALATVSPVVTPPFFKATPLSSTPKPPAAVDEAPKTGPVTVAAEAAMLGEADRALEAGDPARALERLDAHAKSFPTGVLAEEREAERVVVLCALGRVDEARAAGAAFVRERPQSPLVSRIRASCGAP